MAPDETSPESELQRLRQENEHLRLELRRLHAAPAVTTIAGRSLVATLAGRGSGTVAGLEEMILQVNPDQSIGYLNAPMARLLGVSDRRGALGDSLSRWDNGALGPGVLRSIVEAALVEAEGVLVDRSCPGLDPTRLPDAAGPRPQGDPVVRFAAKAVKGRVEIAAQDVSRLRWLENTFARYVAPEVIEQMLACPASDYLQMERREITVLFADLRGFTRIAQGLLPRVLQEMINSFLSGAVEGITAVGGTVDKFAGDEVMALFGAPVASADHALRGLLAAVDLQRRHTELMTRWTAAGLPAPALGVGLTSGQAAVGNLGAPTRMEYTAIGHTVNLAARLCGAAEGGEILTIAETYRCCAEALKTADLGPVPRFKFSPKGKLTFKNVDQPVSVLAVSAL